MDKMKIMLIDDEERFLSSTSKLLQRKGYNAVTAASGTEALAKLKSSSIHLGLSNIPIDLYRKP